jgi:hypothetical protein
MPTSQAVSGADNSNAPRAGRVLAWGGTVPRLVRPSDGPGMVGAWARY